MSKKKSATKKQIKGQQKLFSFFSRANDPKPILKKNATTNGGKKQKQPSPNQASRKETPTPETLKRKAPPSSSSSVGGKSPGAKVGLVDSPSSTNSSDNNSSSIEIGASLRVYNSKEDAWHMVSVYDYRKNEDKHLVKYLNNGDTEWISFKTKKYEVVEKHPSKKLDIKTLISLLPVDEITSIKQI